MKLQFSVFFQLILLLIISSQRLASQTPTFSIDGQFAEKFCIVNATIHIGITELSHETRNLSQTQWDRIFAFYPHKTIHSSDEYNQVKVIKQEKNQMKINMGNVPENLNSDNEVSAVDKPLVFKTFEANLALEGTPTDNSIAVSNGGIIVSAINSNIRYYNTSGNLLFSKTFYDFLGDTTLKSKLYDPQVIYDSGADRFIFVLLHGNHSSTSKVIVCFSKSKNPSDGWYIYYFPVTTLSQVYAFKWFDFPKIGISNDDLFITGNIFKNDEGGFSESVILQITKSNGYEGKTLIWKFWNELFDADGGKPFSLCPVSNGKQGNYGPAFYFLSNKNSGNSNKIYLFEITSKLGNNPILKTYTLTTNTYYLGGDAVQKRYNQSVDPGLLDIGDCRIQSAFYQVSNGEGIIHFVFHSEYNQTYNAINYNRLNLKTLQITNKLYANASIDFAYPAIASASPEYDNSRDVIIAFLFASSNHYPGLAVVRCDDQMNFSDFVVLKEGLTNVNILSNEDERWGDYTGICRKHNTSAPKIWISGAYGSNISDNSVYPPVVKYFRFKNFIAEVADNQNTDMPEDDTLKLNFTGIYPNPVYQSFTVEFNQVQAGITDISIFQADGKYINTLFHDYIRQGKAVLSFDKSSLPQGVYLIRVTTGDKKIIYEKILISD